MKFLHIMKQEKFTKRVVEFYDRFFDKNHEICYISKSHTETQIRNELEITQHEIRLSSNRFSDFKKLNKISKNYDYVVLHSLLLPSTVKLWLYVWKKICKKAIWIEWGADLYSWKSPHPGIQNHIKNKIAYTIRSRCAAAVAIFPPDRETLEKQFPTLRSKVFYAPYSGSSCLFSPEDYVYKSNLSDMPHRPSPVYIQIGHSATPSVNHIAALDAIKKFSQKDIRIFLPLSYGDMDYANTVQNYAEALFPGKVICLREMLPREQYFDIVKKVDIAIFNTNRQIALGNINQMIFQNIKLYMPQTSVMYKYFVSKGVPVQKFEDIADESFEIFAKESLPSDKKAFEEFLADSFNIDKRVKKWQSIYAELEKRSNKCPR